MTTTALRRSARRSVAFALAAVCAAAVLGACGAEDSQPPEPVDPQKLAEEMRTRAEQEITAENLDAEMEKLEREFADDEE